MDDYLIPTYGKDTYLTPVALRKVRRFENGWVILGPVNEPDPFIRDEMLYWTPTLDEAVTYARQKNI